MSDKSENEPAFPQFKVDTWGQSIIKGGMSLRDYFAARASEQDIDFWQEVYYQNNSPIEREQAKYAYADAMLKARG